MSIRTASDTRRGFTCRGLMWGTNLRTVTPLRRALRLVLPLAFAEAVADGPDTSGTFVLTRAAGGGLLGMSERRWARMTREHENAEFLGFYGSGAASVPVLSIASPSAKNANTRFIYLPRELARHAGLEAGGDAAIVGIGQAFIVIRPERWEQAVREFEIRILTLCSACGRVGGASGRPVREWLPATLPERRAA